MPDDHVVAAVVDVRADWPKLPRSGCRSAGRTCPAAGWVWSPSTPRPGPVWCGPSGSTSTRCPRRSLRRPVRCCSSTTSSGTGTGWTPAVTARLPLRGRGHSLGAFRYDLPLTRRTGVTVCAAATVPLPPRIPGTGHRVPEKNPSAQRSWRSRCGSPQTIMLRPAFATAAGKASAAWASVPPLTARTTTARRPTPDNAVVCTQKTSSPSAS